MVTRGSLTTLALAGVAALGLACSEAAKTPQASGSPARAAGRRSPGKAAPASVLDLEAMLAPVPEYEGQGRNLFAFGAARSAQAVEPQPSPPTPVAAPAPTLVVPRPTGPSPAAGARLNVKYAGFLEKTQPDGEKSKYAIFLDGNEILAGSEGETVANRFTVVEIGLESVTVAQLGTTVTQRIPLQSN